MYAGATPNVTASASESRWLPSSEIDRVRRATHPSTASNTMPRKTSTPASQSPDHPHGPTKSAGFDA
jgi:hypothetical protein